jgi:plastocyanin
MRRTVGVLLLSVGLLVLGGAFAIGVNAGGGCHGAGDPAAPTDAASSIVRIETCAFGPTVNRVPVGTSVTFVNSDRIPHNVIGVAAGWGSDKDLDVGAAFSQRFLTAGVFPYACTLHPGMNGAVVVGEADTALASSTSPVVTSETPAPAGASPVGLALAGAGGLAIGALGAGLLFRRRGAEEPGD